jgi:hypothetical protein
MYTFICLGLFGMHDLSVVLGVQYGLVFLDGSRVRVVGLVSTMKTDTGTESRGGSSHIKKMLYTPEYDRVAHMFTSTVNRDHFLI